MPAVPGSCAVVVERLSPGDLVAVAGCIVLDADAFPYASATFGLRAASARAWIARGVGDQAGPGRVVGFAAAQVRRSSLHIEGLTVARSARRLGIGRALVRKAVGAARGERMRAVALHVSVANREAIALYRAEGFEMRARLGGFYPPATYDGETDAYLMELTLRPPLRTAD